MKVHNKRENSLRDIRLRYDEADWRQLLSGGWTHGRPSTPYASNRGPEEGKTEGASQPGHGFAVPMIMLIVLGQSLRQASCNRLWQQHPCLQWGIGRGEWRSRVRCPWPFSHTHASWCFHVFDNMWISVGCLTVQTGWKPWCRRRHAHADYPRSHQLRHLIERHPLRLQRHPPVLPLWVAEGAAQYRRHDKPQSSALLWGLSLHCGVEWGTLL